MLYTPHEAANKLIPAWTAGHVVTAVDRAPDFYTVARREIDGTQGPSFEVPVSRLVPFRARRTPDGGASLQTKHGYHPVDAIVSHTDDADGLRFTVRWADGDVSQPPFVADLIKTCRGMLEAYASRNSIAWDRIRSLR